MSGDKKNQRQPRPERLQALRALPPHVVQSLTKEEVQAFLFEDEWPDSMAEKLKDYLFDE